MSGANTQTSLFGMIDEQCRRNAENTIPLLMHPGDVVYFVHKGDIKTGVVTDEKSWLHSGNKDRGYSVSLEEGGYDCAHNSTLGVSAFTKLEDAERAANAYIETHEVLLASEMRLSNIQAYGYIRDCDEREIVAYMGELGNGLLYVKGFLTYVHIVKDTPTARRDFECKAQTEKKYHPDLSVKDFVPKLKNMYPCKEQGLWLYAEAEYMH